MFSLTSSHAKYIVVTGATGGIGQAVVEKLASVGVRSIICYRQPRRAAAIDLASKCDGFAVELDLASSESIDTALKSLRDAGMLLSGVVLLAAQPPQLEYIGRLTEDDFRRHWQVSVTGNQRLLAGLISGPFRAQKKGVVLGVLSEAMGGDGVGATPRMGGYTVGKFGLLGLLSVIAADYPWLSVKWLYPGFTDTNMLDAIDPRFRQKKREEMALASPDTVASGIVSQLSLFGAIE